MSGEERRDAIDIDGRRYSYRVLGEGPPLLLLNGYSACAQDWEPTFLGPLAEPFTVICPDHRGMGESDLGDGGAVTIDAMATDVERLLDALGIERAPIAGWSMGGFITQTLARRDPSRVAAMVLMSTDSGGSATVRSTPEAWAQLTDHSGTPREQATRLIPLLFPPSLAPAIDQAFGDLVAQARVTLNHDACGAQTRAMAEWHAQDQPPIDPGAAPAALVMHGTEDVLIPPQNAAVLAELWPVTDVEIFVGGGHSFFTLEPARAADRIIPFCRG